MWSFLLLLSLMTGCEATSEVKGCQEQWVEFTCNYTKTYDSIVVVDPRQTPKKVTKKDVWETKDYISLYHNTKNKKLKVVIKQLQPQDFGQYRCKFYGDPKSLLHTEEINLVDVKDDCQGRFVQTAYRTAKTTITCNYPGNKYKSAVMFFCKENKKSNCEDILSSPNSNMIFSLTENNSIFSMSISKVSSHHDGVYWCGMKSNDGRYRTALRRIQLVVKDISKFKRSPAVGETFTYWCEYPEDAPINKFICKGEDPSICEPLVSTAQPGMNTGRFLMKDDKVKRNITITVREVTTDDNGTYWCGAESTDSKRSNPFFHRLVMTVASSPTSAAKRNGPPRVLIILIICMAVLLLLFVLILILIYKRFLHLENTSNGAVAQQIREDYVYEEIQEHIERPDPGNPVRTIYATANRPTNPPASLHYSAIKFQNGSNKAGGEAVILKPSSSACEYSTVNHSQSPAYYTVNEPSTASHEPLYATINKPQQQSGHIGPVRKS